jgi:hypothetical protein
MNIDTAPLRIGLRFERNDARILQTLADRAKRSELGKRDVATFQLAAEAARTGEPLIVLCAFPEEAIAMADGYALYGVRRPGVEALSA